MSRRRPEHLVLDIETIPDESRWSHPDEAAFPPSWAHRIIVIGYLWLDADHRLKQVGVIGGDGAGDALEADLLASFSRTVGRAHPTLVTWNGRSFDLPVIALRALGHGVPLPWYYRDGVRSRYREDGHLDLCDWLADHGAARSGSLDAIARLCGLPGKVGVDGSQVGGLYRAGQLDAIERYCLTDVAQTALLFLRFRLLQGVLPPPAYQAAIDALLQSLDGEPRLAEMMAGIDRDRLRSTHEHASPDD